MHCAGLSTNVYLHEKCQEITVEVQEATGSRATLELTNVDARGEATVSAVCRSESGTGG